MDEEKTLFPFNAVKFTLGLSSKCLVGVIYFP